MIFILSMTLFASVATSRDSEPGIIAHRGFWKSANEEPHNSIASLKNATELGCFGTEFDVHITRDGVPVVFHNSQTDNDIDIQHTDWSELKAKGQPLSNGEPIPTLDEYLKTWKKSDRKVKLILEIKSHYDAERDREAARVILETVRSNRIKARDIEYIAFSRTVCKALSDLECGSPIAYLSGDMTPQLAKEQLGCSGIDYNMDVLRKHPEWIEQAHNLGMTVNVWTVNRPEDIEHCISSGVDYITTDIPDKAMEIVQR